MKRVRRGVFAAFLVASGLLGMTALIAPARGAAIGDNISNSGGRAVDANGTDPTPGAAFAPTVGGWSGSASLATPNIICQVATSCGKVLVTNYAAVVNYAVKYAGTDLGTGDTAGYNHNYPSFSNDCQNFVSQALRAGGWADDFAGSTVDPTNYREWYFRNDPFNGQLQWSTTWDNTWWFMRFLYNNPNEVRGYYLGAWSQAVAGDIVQVDWDGASNGLKPSHAMIITKAGSSLSDIKITQHTTNRLNYSLLTDMSNFPNATWWLVQPY